MAKAAHYFSPATFSFLRNIAGHNNRDWFEQNKPDYEANVRGPALAFIEDMAPDLAIQSPHFLALPRKVGGSLMRIYRDVRFGKDKRPYKTNIGIQFRHERGKDVHAPGFYVHIEPGNCFVGVGIWRPDASALTNIRTRIVDQPDNWRKAISAKSFKKQFELQGESLIRPPRGFDPEHPLIDDLKRKDFIAVSSLTDEQVRGTSFKKIVLDRFQKADEYMHFLCKALELNY